MRWPCSINCSLSWKNCSDKGWQFDLIQPFSLIFRFSPIIHHQKLRFLARRMTVKEQECRALSVARQGYSSLGIHQFAARGVWQMRGAPDIIQFIRPNGVQICDNRTPRTEFIIGKIDRIGWPPNPVDFREAV